MNDNNTNEKIEITARMHEFIRDIGTGPKTTHDLVRTQMVSASSVEAMVHKMNDLGIVTSAQDRKRFRMPRVHQLTAPYKDLMKNIEIKAWSRQEISEPELYYMAILRNADMTGQQRITQCHNIFGGTPGRIKNIMLRAIARR